MKLKHIIFLLGCISWLGMLAQTTTTGNNPALQSISKQRGTISVSERAKTLTDKINNVVQLDPRQYRKVLKLNKEFLKTQLKSFKKAKPQATPMVREVKTDITDRDKKLETILTAEQWKKWQEGKTTLRQAERGSTGRKIMTGDK